MAELKPQKYRFVRSREMIATAVLAAALAGVGVFYFWQAQQTDDLSEQTYLHFSNEGTDPSSIMSLSRKLESAVYVTVGGEITDRGQAALEAMAERCPDHFEDLKETVRAFS